MRTRMFPGALMVVAAVMAQQAAGDSTGRNWVYVTASTTDGTAYHGDRYAKCIPAEDSGSKGKTRVYRVTADEDVLEDEYDWYATQGTWPARGTWRWRPGYGVRSLTSRIRSAAETRIRSGFGIGSRGRAVIRGSASLHPRLVERN